MSGEMIPTAMNSWMQDMARTVIEGQAGVSRSITYRRQTAETYDPTTQTSAPTVSDTTVTALRYTYQTEEVTPGAQSGKVGYMVAPGAQSGKVGYMVEKRRLAFTPTTDDRIVDGSEVYEVQDWTVDGGSLFWKFRVRKVAA